MWPFCSVGILPHNQFIMRKYDYLWIVMGHVDHRIAKMLYNTCVSVITSHGDVGQCVEHQGRC